MNFYGAFLRKYIFYLLFKIKLVPYDSFVDFFKIINDSRIFAKKSGVFSFILLQNSCLIIKGSQLNKFELIVMYVVYFLHDLYFTLVR